MLNPSGLTLLCAHLTDYVLSDPSRRRAYDNQRSSRQSFPGGFTADNTDSASANFFSQFFGKNGPGAPFAETAADDGGDEDDTESEWSSGGRSSSSRRPDADYVFTDVFEDLLTPEVERVVPFWKWMGAASGAVMGVSCGAAGRTGCCRVRRATVYLS